MRLIGALLALALVAGACTGDDHEREPGARAGPPNVLIVITDDQRADGTLGVMPATRRWFAENGTRFSNAYATTPLCCPSRASIFSGRYAHNHDVLKNTEPELLDQETTIQRYLSDDGYRTGFYGKYFNAWEVENPPPHFDDWAISTHGYYGAEFGTPDGVRKIRRYSTTYLANRALGFLEEAEAEDDEPWLLFVSTSAMHKPFTPERRYRDADIPPWRANPAVGEEDTSDKPNVGTRGLTPAAGRRQRARQLRTLMSVDDALERIARFLDERAESDETLAIFVSDNGISWGEHGFLGKRLPYRESVRIPLMVRWPAGTEAEPVDRSLVANIDIAPTVFEATGVDAAHEMDGLPLQGARERALLLLEQWGNYSKGLPDWASVFTERSQYVEYYGREGRVLFRELYDLRRDPWQLDNTANESKQIVRRLDGPLRELRRCSGSSCNR